MLGEVRFEGLSVGTDDEVDEAARQVERDVEGGRTETHGGEWGERRGAGQTMHADDEQEHEDVVDEQAHDAPLDDPVACGGAQRGIEAAHAARDERKRLERQRRAQQRRDPPARPAKPPAERAVFRELGDEHRERDDRVGEDREEEEHPKRGRRAHGVRAESERQPLLRQPPQVCDLGPQPRQVERKHQRVEGAASRASRDLDGEHVHRRFGGLAHRVHQLRLRGEDDP